MLRNILTTADKILMISVILISVMLWTFPIINAYRNERDLEVVIEYKQQKIEVVALSNNGIYSFSFSDHIAEYEIKDGHIRMLPMARDLCPNAICSDTGWINSPVQVIVCIPNQITVKIQGKYISDIDGIVY